MKAFCNGNIKNGILSLSFNDSQKIKDEWVFWLFFSFFSFWLSFFLFWLFSPSLFDLFFLWKKMLNIKKISTAAVVFVFSKVNFRNCVGSGGRGCFVECCKRYFLFPKVRQKYLSVADLIFVDAILRSNILPRPS